MRDLRARTARALARAGHDAPRELDALERWLSIPSVSPDIRCARDVRRAAWWWARAMDGLGADVVALPARPGPVIVADLAAGPTVDSAAPTLLVYGHYDVQPSGPGWTSPPFTPVRRGGRLLARGAADDKGPLAAVLAALRAWGHAGGPPCRVVVVAEGAEEIGSPGLRAALTRVAARVRPDVVLVCDTEQASDGVPSVTVSQRGALRLRVDVDVGGRPVHAGRLGGAVVDPARRLVSVLARLADVVGRAGTAVTAPPAAASLVRTRPDVQLRRAAGGRAVEGSRLDERATLRPSFSVTRLVAGSAAGAIPVRAHAEVDVRLPPGRDTARAANALVAAARTMASDAVDVRVRVTGSHPGGWWIPDAGLRRSLDRAALATFGVPPSLVRSGGSLPAARILADVTGRTPILLGLAPAGSGAHGPDEFLDVAGWVTGVRMLVHLLADLAETSAGGVTRSRGVASGLSHDRGRSMERPRGVTCP